MAEERFDHLHQDLLRDWKEGTELARKFEETFDRGVELFVEEVGFGLWSVRITPPRCLSNN